MVTCSVCGDRFHQGCVAVDAASLSNRFEYICVRCGVKALADHVGEPAERWLREALEPYSLLEAEVDGTRFAAVDAPASTREALRWLMRARDALRKPVPMSIRLNPVMLHTQTLPSFPHSPATAAASATATAAVAPKSRRGGSSRGRGRGGRKGSRPARAAKQAASSVAAAAAAGFAGSGSASAPQSPRGGGVSPSSGAPPIVSASLPPLGSGESQAKLLQRHWGAGSAGAGSAAAVATVGEAEVEEASRLPGIPWLPRSLSLLLQEADVRGLNQHPAVQALSAALRLKWWVREALSVVDVPDTLDATAVERLLEAARAVPVLEPTVVGPLRHALQAYAEWCSDARAALRNPKTSLATMDELGKQAAMLPFRAQEFGAVMAALEDGCATYCVCHCFNDGRMMVGCEHCNSWFHADCVGFTGDAENTPFYCRRCSLQLNRPYPWAERSAKEVADHMLHIYPQVPEEEAAARVAMGRAVRTIAVAMGASFALPPHERPTLARDAPRPLGTEEPAPYVLGPADSAAPAPPSDAALGAGERTARHEIEAAVAAAEAASGSADGGAGDGEEAPSDAARTSSSSAPRPAPEARLATGDVGAVMYTLVPCGLGMGWCGRLRTAVHLSLDAAVRLSLSVGAEDEASLLGVSNLPSTRDVEQLELEVASLRQASGVNPSTAGGRGRGGAHMSSEQKEMEQKLKTLRIGFQDREETSSRAHRGVVATRSLRTKPRPNARGGLRDRSVDIGQDRSLRLVNGLYMDTSASGGATRARSSRRAQPKAPAARPTTRLGTGKISPRSFAGASRRAEETASTPPPAAAAAAMKTEAPAPASAAGAPLSLSALASAAASVSVSTEPSPVSAPAPAPTRLPAAAAAAAETVPASLSPAPEPSHAPVVTSAPLPPAEAPAQADTQPLAPDVGTLAPAPAALLAQPVLQVVPPVGGPIPVTEDNAVFEGGALQDGTVSVAPPAQHAGSGDLEAVPAAGSEPTAPEASAGHPNAPPSQGAAFSHPQAAAVTAVPGVPAAQRRSPSEYASALQPPRPVQPGPAATQLGDVPYGTVYVHRPGASISARVSEPLVSGHTAGLPPANHTSETPGAAPLPRDASRM